MVPAKYTFLEKLRKLRFPPNIHFWKNRENEGSRQIYIFRKTAKMRVPAKYTFLEKPKMKFPAKYESGKLRFSPNSHCTAIFKINTCYISTFINIKDIRETKKITHISSFPRQILQSFP